MIQFPHAFDATDTLDCTFDSLFIVSNQLIDRFTISADGFGLFTLLMLTVLQLRLPEQLAVLTVVTLVLPS